MALWTLKPNDRGNLDVVFFNRTTGQVHHCGEVRPETSLSMLAEWMIREAQPLDVVEIGGRRWVKLCPPESPSA